MPLIHKNPQPLAAPNAANGRPFDRFSLLHFAGGAVMGMLDFRPAPALAAAIGWDVLERPLKDFFPQFFPVATQDSPRHVMCDVACVMTGYTVIQALGHRKVVTFRKLP